MPRDFNYPVPKGAPAAFCCWVRPCQRTGAVGATVSHIGERLSAAVLYIGSCLLPGENSWDRHFGRGMLCRRSKKAGVGSHRHKSRSPRRQSSASGANAQSEGLASLDLLAVNSSPGASKSTRTKKSVKDEGPASKYAKLPADLQQQVHLAASQASSVSGQAPPSN